MKTSTIQHLQQEIRTVLAVKEIIRLCTVMQKVGLSRSTIYTMMEAGQFPRSISLGLRSIGWLSSDIDNWIDTKVTASKTAIK